MWHRPVLPKSLITKITLQDMTVTAALLMSLQLQQCQQLHTLCIGSGCTMPLSAGTADTAATLWVQQELATLQQGSVAAQMQSEKHQQQQQQGYSWLPPSLKCLDLSGCTDAAFFEHLVLLVEPYIRELRLHSLTDRLFEGLRQQLAEPKQKQQVAEPPQQQQMAEFQQQQQQREGHQREGGQLQQGQAQGRKSVLELVTACTLELYQDHSQQDVIRWQRLEVTKATHSWQLVNLPLQHIQQLAVHEGFLGGLGHGVAVPGVGVMAADLALELRLKASGTQLICVPQWCKELGQPVFSLHGPCLASLAGLCADNLATTCGLHIDDVSPLADRLRLYIGDFPPKVNLLSLRGKRDAFFMQPDEDVDADLYQPFEHALPETIARIAYYPVLPFHWKHIRALAMALASSPTHSHVAIIVVLPETEGLTEHQLQQALEGCPRVNIIWGEAEAPII